MPIPYPLALPPGVVPLPPPPPTPAPSVAAIPLPPPLPPEGHGLVIPPGVAAPVAVALGVELARRLLVGAGPLSDRGKAVALVLTGLLALLAASFPQLARGLTPDAADVLGRALAYGLEAVGVYQIGKRAAVAAGWKGRPHPVKERPGSPAPPPGT